MTLPKGSVQQGAEKSGIHVGTTNNAGNKEINESCGIASDFIQHQRDHYQYATPSKTEEIPAFATQPWSLPPHRPLLFPAQHCFRCIHLRALPYIHGWDCPCLSWIYKSSSPRTSMVAGYAGAAWDTSFANSPLKYKRFPHGGCP